MSSEKSELYEALSICKNESGASDMDVEKLENRVAPVTKEAKCLEACYLNYMEVVSGFRCSCFMTFSLKYFVLQSGHKIERCLFSTYINFVFSDDE